MNAGEARDHLEMVDRILQQAECRPYRPIGGLLVAWGIGAALMEIAAQLSKGAGPSGPLAIAGTVVLAASFIYTIVATVFSRRNAERMPASEAMMGRVMGAVWLCIWIAAIAQEHMFPGWAAGAIWNVGGAISLLAGGFLGDRRGLFGGSILLASVVVANFWFVYPGYVLAAGFLIGYVGVGIAYLVSNARTPASE